MSPPVRVPLIAVENLGFHYPGADNPALQDVSLTIRAGSCFGLLGPNGAGKTTLLSILTGLKPVQQGRLLWRGDALSGKTALKKASALVPQEYAFYPTLSGLENLHFFSRLSGLSGPERSAQLQKAIETAGLESVLSRRAGNYSGGLKRRLNLAVGLVGKPAILYLDEPTVGIDAQSRRFILDAINRLKKEGMTIVYTSHYMEEIQTICDDVAVIDHGKVLVQDSLPALLRAGPDCRLKLRLDGEPDSAARETLEKTFGLHVSGVQLASQAAFDPARLQPLFAALGDLKLGVAEMHFGLNRLEDIYLSLTRREL